MYRSIVLLLCLFSCEQLVAQVQPQWPKGRSEPLRDSMPYIFMLPEKEAPVIDYGQMAGFSHEDSSFRFYSLPMDGMICAVPKTFNRMPNAFVHSRKSLIPPHRIPNGFPVLPLVPGAESERREPWHKFSERSNSK